MRPRCVICGRTYPADLRPKHRKTCGAECSGRLARTTHRVANAKWHKNQREEMGNEAWLSMHREAFAKRVSPKANRERVRKAYWRAKGVETPPPKRKYAKK